jgi:hypothetical protein
MERLDGLETCTTAWDYEDDEQAATADKAQYLLGSTHVMTTFGGPRGCGNLLEEDVRGRYRSAETWAQAGFYLAYLVTLPLYCFYRLCAFCYADDEDRDRTLKTSGKEPTE